MRNRIKWFVIVAIVVNLFAGSIAFGTNGAKVIEVLLNSANLNVNGQKVEVDNILYNGTTYAPFRAVGEMLGKEVGWDSNTNTASITDGQSLAVNDDFILHGLYALESYDQYSEFNRSRTLSNFDSISFGWCKIGKKNNEIELLLSGEDSKDFYVPSGYNNPLNTADANKISKQLMVFADDYFTEILDKKEILVDQIIGVVDGQNGTFSMLEFDGVTIDFEFINKENQKSFVEFLRLLRGKLGSKKLYVTVPSINNYEHYLWEEIISTVDYMIIMEHDFDDKQLQAGYVGNSIVKTPLSPIDKIESDLKVLIGRVGQDNEKKILLQLSFDATQWGVKDGYLYTTAANGDVIKPSNPSYEQIYDRMNKEINEKSLKVSDLIHYDQEFQNPYLQYFNETKSLNILKAYA